MAVDTQTFDVLTEISGPESPAAPAAPSPDIPTRGRLFTGIAVFDGQQWTALCKELDIASIGGSATEALHNLEDAVRVALEVAAENGLSPGVEVPEEDLREFMLSHQRAHAISLLTFRA